MGDYFNVRRIDELRPTEGLKRSFGTRKVASVQISLMHTVKYWFLILTVCARISVVVIAATGSHLSSRASIRRSRLAVFQCLEGPTGPHHFGLLRLVLVLVVCNSYPISHEMAVSA